MQSVKVEEKEKEAVETVNAPEKVEHTEVETSMVDWSDNDVLSKLLLICNICSET